MEIEKVISKMRKIELEEKKKSRKKEHFRVNVNPDSIVGREMRYQTALLHEILNETRELKESIEKRGK